MNFFFVALISFSAFAQEAPKALDVVPSATVSSRPQMFNRTLKLEDVRIKDEQLQRRDIEAFRNRELRVSGGGGDDVGNGGDELRQEFLFLGEQILEEIDNKELRSKLQGALSIRRVIVVEELSVRRGSEDFKMKSLVVEGFILLDAVAWSPLLGLLAPGNDPRFEMIKLLAEAQGVKVSSDLLLHAWHSLSPRQGLIWCPVVIEKTKLIAQAKDFEASHTASATLAEQEALRLCRVGGYEDCRIAESVERGFGAWAKSYATARGQKYKTDWKSSSEMQQERCEAVRLCEMVHEWAPAGQVRPAAFVTLETEASKSCR